MFSWIRTYLFIYCRIFFWIIQTVKFLLVYETLRSNSVVCHGCRFDPCNWHLKLIFVSVGSRIHRPWTLILFHLNKSKHVAYKHGVSNRAVLSDKHSLIRSNAPNKTLLNQYNVGLQILCEYSVLCFCLARLAVIGCKNYQIRVINHRFGTKSRTLVTR